MARIGSRSSPGGLSSLGLILVILVGSPVRASPQEKKLEPITVSYASITGNRAPFWIAKELGIFEKHGLDVNLIYIASGFTSVNALLGGSVDVIAASGLAAVGAAARGAPILIIASLGPTAYKLVGHPSISSIQDLKGKTVGSSRIGSGADYALRRLLPKLGLEPGKDVQLIPTGISESDRRLMIMLQGKIDATLATVDHISQLELQGQKVSVLADLLEAGVYTTGSDIATSRQLLKDRPRRIKSFLMALSEGIWIGRNNREMAFRVYRKYMKVENPKILESMQRNYLQIFIPAKPYPREEAVQSDIEDLSHTYPQLKGKKAAEFFDVTLLKELEGEGFFARLHQRQ